MKIIDELGLILLCTPRAGSTLIAAIYLHCHDQLAPLIGKLSCGQIQMAAAKLGGEIAQLDINRQHYKKVKFVRNPYKRAVSSYYIYLVWALIGRTDKSLSFRQFLLAFERGELTDPHYITQSGGASPSVSSDIIIIKVEMIDHLHNHSDPSVRKLGKVYQNMKQKYPPLMRKIHHRSLKNTKLTEFLGDMSATKLVKLSDRLAPKACYFYNDEIRRIVERVYGRDIIEYGYEYPFD